MDRDWGLSNPQERGGSKRISKRWGSRGKLPMYINSNPLPKIINGV
jgi:hypothetical protein